MEQNLMPDDAGDPPPAVNWALVDDDQEWRRKEGSKSAPPKLNVSGFPGADFLFRPEFDPLKRPEDCGDGIHGPMAQSPPLSSTFQEFINSVTKLTDSPEPTPTQSLTSSFSSIPNTNQSFTSLLLRYSSSQTSRKAGRALEPFAMIPDSPAMLPADGAMPIRIPGFGTSPQAQSYMLGTPPATLASLGGEPYLANSPNLGNVNLGLQMPQASWPRPAHPGLVEDHSMLPNKGKKDMMAKHKGQRLTFQDSKEPLPARGKTQGKDEGQLVQTIVPSSGSRSNLPGVKGQGKGAVVADPRPVDRRLFPALEGEIDGRLSSLEDVIGNIYLTAKDQYGCRFLQKMLEDGPPQCLQQILDEVYDHSVELMTDPFGNYLMQKLVEHCNDDQRTLIAQRVAPQLVNISLNMHGTRAVQTLIENLTNAVQVQIIIAALQDSVVPLIKDLNGNHVIQRCLQKFTARDKQFVYDAAIPRCVDVATHRHGCCVVQRCIDHASEEQKGMLVDEIARHAFTLVTDPFGNYVVQYVLDLNIEAMVRKICQAFRGSFCNLCTNKFSSNVMEKCLQIAPEDVQEVFIHELMDNVMLPKLLQDQYANYVVQTALTVSKPQQFAMLQEAIRAHLHLVRNTPYGKKIENKLNRGAGRGGGGAGSRGGKSRANAGGPGGGHPGGKGYGGGPGGPHQMHQHAHHHHTHMQPRGLNQGPGHMPAHMHAHHHMHAMHSMGPMAQGHMHGMPGPMGMPPNGRMGPPGMPPPMMGPGPMGMEPRADSWDDHRAQMYWT